MKITRNASCGLLRLTPDLACRMCKSNIIKSNLEGIAPKRIKSCRQPWRDKWSNHRKTGIVCKQPNILQYLDSLTSNESRTLVNTSLYPSTRI